MKLQLTQKHSRIDYHCPHQNAPTGIEQQCQPLAVHDLAVPCEASS